MQLSTTITEGNLALFLLAEALEAWKKVENSIVSFAAVGISIDTEAASEASGACATAQALIVSLFPAGLILSLYSAPKKYSCLPYMAPITGHCAAFLAATLA